MKKVYPHTRGKHRQMDSRAKERRRKRIIVSFAAVLLCRKNGRSKPLPY